MTMPLQEMLEGKYEILAKIGEGGIGSVYKVKHRLLEEIRVIKVLRPQAASKEEIQRRFLREAKMAIRLKHPNIAQLYDFAVTDEGTAYIVMEFIDGVGLNAVLKATGPPSVDLTIALATQALEALGYLHDQKFVHRDISPDNIMLASDHSGGPVVKLIDLGIAKNLEAVAQLTQTGVFLGKVRYSSPEQFSAKAGSDELDHRSDIYSFGVMLYQLLTGEYPFEGDSFTELAGCHLFQAPRAFDETDKDGRIETGLREAVLKALEKEPDNRHASAMEFAEALTGFRNPKSSLRTELDTTIRATAVALPKISESKEPGSTQSRLDRDFGMVTTPEPSRVTEMTGKKAKTVDLRQLTKDAAKIDKILAAGKQNKAQRLLDKALARHGEVPELAKYREMLADEPTTVAPATQPAPAASGKGKRLPMVAAGLGVAALLALAAVGWFLWRSGGGGDGDGDGDAVAERGETVAVDPAERWTPETGDADLALTAVPQPPPTEAEAAAIPAPEESAPRAEPTPPSDPSGRPAPEAGPPGTGPEGRRPQPGGPPGDQPPPEHRPPPPGDPRGGPPPRGRTQEVYQPGALGVIPPVLLHLPPPKLEDGPPRTATTIMVTALVDEHGKVLSTSVKRPSFKRKLKEAAMAAAKGATFRPAVRDGVAGRMYTFIRVDFPAG